MLVQRIQYWINSLSSNWYFSLFSSLIWLILYWYCKEKFWFGYSWELRVKKHCIHGAPLHPGVQEVPVSKDFYESPLQPLIGLLSWHTSRLFSPFHFHSRMNNIFLCFSYRINFNNQITVDYKQSYPSAKSVMKIDISVPQEAPGVMLMHCRSSVNEVL